MQQEQEAAESLKLDWKTRCFCPANVAGHKSIIEHSTSQPVSDQTSLAQRARAFIQLRLEYYRWLKSLEMETDIYLLRHYSNDPLEYYFIRQSKNPVFLVHHTLESEELATSGVLSTVRILLENYWGKKSIEASSCVIGATQEIVNYELSRIGSKDKPAILYPNGIKYRDQKLTLEGSKKPEIIFVAGSFAPWHGLDLLLDDIRESKDDFTLHLVGNISKDLEKQINQDSRIKIHGFMDKTQIEKLSSHCQVGLSSFGLSRINMQQACTLKVREYLELGLPVYAGYSDVFPSSFPFFKKGPPSIKTILKFAESMALVDRSKISLTARPFIDKTALVKELYDNISKINCQKNTEIYEERRTMETNKVYFQKQKFGRESKE